MKAKSGVAEDQNYRSLADVLEGAYQQACSGKGKERHAEGEAFEKQQICEINRRLKGSPIAGVLFQAVKKCYETKRLPRKQAIAELQGAINYIAAGIILLQEEGD